MIELLCVRPRNMNYLNNYHVSVASSYEEAKQMICSAEQSGKPYDQLDLPIYDSWDEKEFWDFLKWMTIHNRRYAFSVFGIHNTFKFVRIRNRCRDMGFTFIRLLV